MATFSESIENLLIEHVVHLLDNRPAKVLEERNRTIERLQIELGTMPQIISDLQGKVLHLEVSLGNSNDAYARALDDIAKLRDEIDHLKARRRRKTRKTRKPNPK
jgi:chromosome segregation ATPase